MKALAWWRGYFQYAMEFIMGRSLNFVIGVILVISWFVPCAALGATLKAASCSSGDVQTAISLAKEGDIIAVPAGQCTWSTGVNIFRKGITVAGAGIDQTIITDNTRSDYLMEPFFISGERGKPFRITGFTFKGMKRRSTTEPAILMAGDCMNWRIDNCKFDATGTEGRGVITAGYGVIDHCIFKNTYQGVAVEGDGDAAWDRPLTLGTENAVYIEDCTFDYNDPYDGAVDAYNGARYVFRYNSVTNTLIGHHGLDSGGTRSTHSWEIYNNTFAVNKAIYTLGGSRGGTGVVHGNVATGPYDRFFLLINYRSCCNINNNCSNWGRCDGANPIDGNEDPTGYPCMDQNGRTTNQILSPIYEWNNTLNGSDGDIELFDPWECTNPSMSDHIKEGRDFYNDTKKPGYISYTYPHPLVRGEKGISTPQRPRAVQGKVR
jgi:hypothetical protein